MRIVCAACDAKYSISDDKVAGKVFKIRCKKCSNVIVIRSAAPAAVDTPPPVNDDWHAVVNNEQIGPFDAKELSRRRDAGELDDDTYVWREGMTDWVPLGTIDALRKPAAAVEPPPASDVARLRGERNETSVLFTLGNLAKLASPAPIAASPATSSEGKPVEGSGLIDIRALASTLAPAAGAPPPSASMPEIPVYATVGFADPIVLVPSHRRGPSRIAVAVVALAALLVIVTSVLIIVLMKPDKRESTQVAAVTPPPPTKETVTEPPPAPPPVTQPAPPPVVQPPTPAAPPPSPPPVAPKHRTKTQTSTRPAPIPPQLQPAEASCDEITCEASGFAGKCCEKYKPSSSNTSNTTSNLPDHLDASLLKTGIATIDVRRCSGKSSGMVSVSVKISPAGTVTGVTIKSSPDDAASECVTAAAKKGTFAKTQRGGSFAYVWRL